MCLIMGMEEDGVFHGSKGMVKIGKGWALVDTMNSYSGCSNGCTTACLDTSSIVCAVSFIYIGREGWSTLYYVRTHVHER